MKARVVALCAFAICNCSPPPAVSPKPCVSFAAGLNAASALRKSGRLIRASRAYAALDQRCDRTGEARATKQDIADALATKDEPLALVRAAELATHAGKVAEAQELYDKALVRLRALDLHARLEFPAAPAAPTKLAVDGTWCAARFGDEVHVFDGTSPRFVFPLPRTIAFRVDAPTNALLADDGTGWSLTTGRALPADKPPKRVPGHKWRSLEDLVRLTAPTPSDDVVAAQKLANGKMVELVATVVSKATAKDRPTLTRAIVQLSTSELDEAGVRRAAVDLVRLKCDVDARGPDSQQRCEGISAARFSADGSVLLVVHETGAETSTAFVFDGKSGDRRATLTTDAEPETMRLSTNGTLLFGQSYTIDKTRSRLYELRDAGFATRWERDDVPRLTDPALRDDGSIALVAHGDIMMLDGETGAPTTVTVRRLGALGVPLVAAHAPWLAVALSNREVRVLTGRETQTLSRDVMPSALRFDRNRSWLVGGFGGTIDVRDVRNAGRVTVVREMRTWDAVLSPSGRQLVAAGTDVALPTWEIPSRTPLAPFTPSTGAVTHARIDWSHDGKLVEASDDTGTLVFDAQPRTLVRSIPYESTERVLFADDGTIVGLGRHELWRAAPAGGAPSFRVAFGAEASDMALLNDDVFVSLPGVVEWRSLRDGALRGRFEVDAQILHLAASGTKVFVSGPRGATVIGQRAFGFARVGEIRFGPEQTIVETDDLTEVIGDASQLLCAVGAWRLPLAACDGIRVDPGPGDLFSGLF